VKPDFPDLCIYSISRIKEMNMDKEFNDADAIVDHQETVYDTKDNRKDFLYNLGMGATNAFIASAQFSSQSLGQFSTPVAMISGVLAVAFTVNAVVNHSLRKTDDSRHKNLHVNPGDLEVIVPSPKNGVSSRSHATGLWMVSHYENGVEVKREALGDKDMKKLEKKMRSSDLPLVKVVGGRHGGFDVFRTVKGKLHNEEGPALQMFSKQSDGGFVEVGRTYTVKGKRLSEEAFRERFQGPGVDSESDIRMAPSPS
jgi:hypothetical protein